MTVVYPVAAVKRLSWLDPDTGEKTRPRRSPKKGTRYDCIRELYALRDYLTRDGFRLCLVFLELEEIRLKNGWGRGGKRGSERMDRLPLGLCDVEFYNEPGRLRPVSARIAAAGLYRRGIRRRSARHADDRGDDGQSAAAHRPFGAGRQAGPRAAVQKEVGGPTMTNDRETENARERLAVRLRETLGAAVREIRPSPQDGIALDVFAGSLPDVAAAAPKLKGAGFWPLWEPKAAERCFWRARIRRTAATRCRI